MHSILVTQGGEITEKTGGGGRCKWKVEDGENYSVRKEGWMLDPKR